MIMNEKFRWFVIEDNFLDKEECGSLIKQIDENGIRTHDDTSDDDSDFIHRREVDPTIENDPYYHKKNQWIDYFHEKSLINRVWNLFQVVNNKHYKFQLEKIYHDSTNKDTIYIKKYGPEFTLKFHTDFCFSSYPPKQSLQHPCGSNLKLIMIVYLNDDFEGGETHIMHYKVKPKIGRAVICPSFASHGVDKHWGGNDNRYALNTWAIGNTFV